MDDQAARAMSWALKGNHLRVYPVITKEIYTIKAFVGKSKTKRDKAMNMVRLCIEIGNAKHMGDQMYQQGEEMSNKIDEIYIHYYNKAHARN